MKLLFSCFLLCGLVSGALAQEPEKLASLPDEVAVEVPVVTEDGEIQSRLLGIFAAINELEDIEVSVQSGVVTLSGVVASSKSAAEAEALAKGTSGVIYVRDKLVDNVEVEARLTPAFEKAQELGKVLIRKLPLILIALLVVALFWVIGSWISRRRWMFRKLGFSELSGGLVRRLVKIVFIGVGLVIAMEILDATALAGAVVGLAGVVGIAFGFAFRNIVENYLAGILLSMRNPFSSGDHIKVDEAEGKVVRLTSRDTVLMTLDGNHLRIPNSTIMTSSMMNFSRNPLRRFDFSVGVSVEQDLVAVRELGLETLDLVESILADPAPTVIIEALGDSTVNMRFFGWIDQTESDFGKSKSEAIRLIKEKFDDVGIEMPEPIYRVLMTETTPTKRVPVKRRSNAASDTSVDTSVDQQVEQASQEDEANLLEE